MSVYLGCELYHSLFSWPRNKFSTDADIFIKMHYDTIINKSSCRCPLCLSRITEHMRWNTYMRVKGYRYGKEKDDMAKIHDDLLPWEQLLQKEKQKD